MSIYYGKLDIKYKMSQNFNIKMLQFNIFFKIKHSPINIFNRKVQQYSL